MATPFKMKENPMQRNFGISPMKRCAPGSTRDGCGGNFKVKKKSNIIPNIKKGIENITSKVGGFFKGSSGKSKVKKGKGGYRYDRFIHSPQNRKGFFGRGSKR